MFLLQQGHKMLLLFMHKLYPGILIILKLLMTEKFLMVQFMKLTMFQSNKSPTPPLRME